MVANKEELFVGFRSMCNERRRMGDGRYSGLHSGGVGHLHAAFLVFCPSVLLSTACPASPASGCGTHSGGGGRVYRQVGSPDTESQSRRGEIEIP
jgi:hypothetical protein